MATFQTLFQPAKRHLQPHKNHKTQHIKLSTLYSYLVAHTAGAYPGLYSIKRLEWDARPSQGYPQHLLVPIYSPG